MLFPNGKRGIATAFALPGSARATIRVLRHDQPVSGARPDGKTLGRCSGVHYRERVGDSVCLFS